MQSNEEWVELRNQLAKDIDRPRWDIHGKKEVDDDYFTALEYVVKKMDETLARANMGNWPSDSDLSDLHDRHCDAHPDDPWPNEMSEDSFKAAIYEALSRWGSNNRNGQPRVVEEVSKDVSQVSDGYHTFSELYEHRHSLCLAMMRAMPQFWWFSRRNFDGELCPKGGDWFIVGAELPGTAPYNSITYYLPMRLWDVAQCTGAAELPKGKPWDGHTPDKVVSRLMVWAVHPKSTGVNPTEDQLRETILKAIDSFPPSHPEAEGLSVIKYERALEVVKARAVLDRWGALFPTPMKGASEEDVAKVIYEEAMRGCSNELNWPQWGDLPVSLARDCAFSAARAVLSLVGKDPVDQFQSSGTLLKDVNIAMNTSSWIDGPSATIVAMANWLRRESQGHLGNGEYWANRIEAEAKR